MTDEVEIKDPKAVLEALERAKADAKKYREELEALQAEYAPIKEELSKMKDDLKNSAIRRAVEQAGADPDRVLTFLKTDGIEYADGKLQGFDESFGELQKQLPELFDPKRRVGGRVEAEVKGDAQQVKSVSELQAERILRML